MSDEIIKIFRNTIQNKGEYSKAADIIINNSEYNNLNSIDDKLKQHMINLIRTYAKRLRDKEGSVFSRLDYPIYEDFINNTLFDFANYVVSKGMIDDSFNRCVKSYYQTRRNKSYKTRYAVSISNSKRGKSLEYCIEQYVNTNSSDNRHKNSLRRLKHLLSTDLNGVKRYIESLKYSNDEQYDNK